MHAYAQPIKDAQIRKRPTTPLAILTETWLPWSGMSHQFQPNIRTGTRTRIHTQARICTTHSVCTSVASVEREMNSYSRQMGLRLRVD